MHTESEKWRPIASIVAQYPANNLSRQYKSLVIKRWIAANAIAFLLLIICLMTSTLLPVPTLVWFASGTACGFTFLRGYRVLAGIWLGCFFAYYAVSHQPALSFSCATIFV